MNKFKKIVLYSMSLIFVLALTLGIINTINKPIILSAESIHFDSNEIKENYGLDETITIYPISAIYQDKEYLASVVLSYGSTYIMTIASDNIDGVKYSFKDIGEYVLTYYLNLSGTIYTHNVKFTVKDAPYFSDTLKSNYQLGADLPLDIYANYKNERIKAEVKIDGNVVTEYRATTVGTINVILSAYINNEYFSETRNISIYLNKNKDLFIGDSISLENSAEAPEWMHKNENSEAYKGMLIRSEQKTNIIRYSNLINLNDFNKDDSLIKFIPISGEYEGEQYTPLLSVSFKIIDAYDSGNYIYYRYFSSGYYSNGSCNLYTQICYDAISQARWNFGDYTEFRAYMINNNSTLDIDHKNGNPKTNVMWLSANVDYSTKKFYMNLTCNEDGELFNILDAGNSKDIGVGKEWQGFKTGEVYLEIEYESSGRKNAILIREIAGQKFEEESISDVTAPNAIFNFADLPIGYLGRSYIIDYPTKIIDTVCGILDNSYCNIDLFYLNGNKRVNLNSKIVDGKFVPNDEGKYLIQYYIFDISGNTQLYERYFTVVYSENSAFAVNPFVDDYYVGTTVILPIVAAENMSTIITQTFSYSLNGNQINKKTGESFFINEQGVFIVNYDIVDYNGTQLKGSYSTEVEVNSLPIITMGNMPDTAICGLSLYLPDFTAFDYNYGSNQEEYTPTRSLSVNGTNVDVNERLYNVTSEDGNELNVIFSAGKAIVTKTIKVITANYLSDYFFATSENGDVVKENGTESLNFTFNNNAIIYPANTCVIDLSESVLSQFELDANQGVLRIILTDYVDDSKQINMVLNFNSKTITYTGSDQTYMFTDNNLSMYYDFSGNFSIGYCKVRNWDNSLPFTGFTQNLFKIKFILEDFLENTTLRLIRLSASELKTKQSNDGEPRTYVYNGKPYLVLSEDVNSTKVAKGDYLKIPQATAWLPFGGMVPVSVTLSNQENRLLLEDVSANVDNYVLMNEYSFYTITYKMLTPSGKVREETIPVEIRCFDPPIINVSGKIEDSYYKGETIKGINISAFGTGEIKIVIALINANGKIYYYNSLSEIKFDTVGINRIVIMANDEWNYSSKFYTVNIKEKNE